MIVALAIFYFIILPLLLKNYIDLSDPVVKTLYIIAAVIAIFIDLGSLKSSCDCECRCRG